MAGGYPRSGWTRLGRDSGQRRGPGPGRKRWSLGLPRNVFWLGMVSFMNDFSSEMVFPLLPLFFTSVLGASPAALGAMEGLVESVASLVKLWTGRMGDRLRRRKPLVVTG
jgi:hypothetical protein